LAYDDLQGTGGPLLPRSGAGGIYWGCDNDSAVGTSFRWILMLPLLVALSDACRDVLTRKMTQSESSLSMVFTTSLIIVAISTLTSYAGWKPLQFEHLWLFGLKTALMLIAYFLLIEAYRYAPTVGIFIGLTLTVGSGIFIAVRETRISIKKRGCNQAAMVRT
jgi:hypothetical protein